jgi:hypothetical protein
LPIAVIRESGENCFTHGLEIPNRQLVGRVTYHGSTKLHISPKLMAAKELGAENIRDRIARPYVFAMILFFS